MTILSILDYTGVVFFAMSGMLAAAGKKLDLFGGLAIAFVTALGGGTLRDVLLNTDVAWIKNPEYIYLVASGALLAVVFKKIANYLRKTVFLFDTVGIALFTILGVQKALLLGSPAPVAVIFGVITATFGGVIRDILCNEIPLIFRSEIYATACLAGGILYSLLYLSPISENLNLLISGSLIAVIRILAVIKKWHLPVN